MNDQNITRIQLADREIIVVGTAHVSKQSAEEVRMVIEAERPDTVCVELDEPRYQSMINGKRWKEMDIFKVIKEKKGTLLLMNLAISSFQNRIAKEMDVQPGAEMLQGIKSAKDVDAELVLADRNIQTTFSRIWNQIGLWGKIKLMSQIGVSIFSKETISEEELEQLKSEDMLNGMLHEFTEHFPKLKVPLIDERDQYLAEKIRTAPGKKVVAVLGAAHVPGIMKEIEKEQDLDKLNEIPPKSVWPKVIGWSIPFLIIGIIAYTLFNNPAAGMQQITSWVLWNGSFSALGVIIAMGHPLAVLTAFVAAPISSLNPLIAAGWFAGFVQAYIRKPTVGDFENLSDDVLTVKGFWRNKVSRILLIIVLANLGSSLGTVIGGADVIRLFLDNL